MRPELHSLAPHAARRTGGSERTETSRGRAPPRPLRSQPLSRRVVALLSPPPDRLAHLLPTFPASGRASRAPRARRRRLHRSRLDHPAGGAAPARAARAGRLQPLSLRARAPRRHARPGMEGDGDALPGLQRRAQPPLPHLSFRRDRGPLPGGARAAPARAPYPALPRRLLPGRERGAQVARRAGRAGRGRRRSRGVGAPSARRRGRTAD